MPSGRGVAVLFAGLSMWLAARIIGSPGLEVVALGLAALPAIAALFVRWGQQRIAIHRSLSDVRVRAGDPGHGADRRREPLVLRHVVPLARGSAAVRARPARPAGRLRASRPVAPQRVSYTVLPQTRGRYQLGPLSIDVSDPFALVRQRLEFDEREELLVTPEIEDLTGTPDAAFGAERRCLPDEEPVPHRRGVLHDASVPRGRRPPPDPLAERRPHRRSDDPPGRVVPARRAGWCSSTPARGCSARSHGQAFERAVSVAATLGPALARTASRSGWPRPTRRRRALSEERFLEALAGIAHAQVRSVGPALARLRASASGDTTLVFVSVAPATRRAHVA